MGCGVHDSPPDPPPPLIWWHEGGITGVYIDPSWEPVARYFQCTCPPPARNVLRYDLDELCDA